MGRRSRVHYTLFFVGIGLLVCSMIVTVTAIGIAFEHEMSTDDSDEIRAGMWGHGVYEYEDLSDGERQYVDGALAGERYVFDVDGSLPGPRQTGWSDHLIVERDDQYHVFTRRPGVDWTSAGGIAGVVLAVAGVFLVLEAIRRHHFPGYTPAERLF